MDMDKEPGSIVILQDRRLAGNVSHVSICPNMELIAVVLDGASVVVFRTNWQRLAAIPVCSKEKDVITALSWSPGGANIVIGTSAGCLYIYSVDRCASATTSRTKRGSREMEPIASKTLPSPPTCVLWANTPVDNSRTSSTTVPERTYEDQALKLLNVISNLPPLCPGFLVIGDRDGLLTVLTHNMELTLCRVRVMPKGSYVHQAYLSKDHTACVAIGYDKALLEADEEYNNTEGVFRSIDISSIVHSWPEIDRLGREAMALRATMEKIESAIPRVKKEWMGGAKDVLQITIKEALEKVIAQFPDEQGSRDAWEALQDVFCGARVTGSMLQFLATDLGENCAKEALRTFRAHADEVEDALFSIRPLSENVVFRATEFRGLARIPSRFRRLGVLFEDATALFDAAETLYLQLSDLDDEFARFAKESETFLAWLVITASKAAGESAQGTASALGNLEAKDSDLVSKFFNRINCSKDNAPSFNVEDPVSSVLLSHVMPALERFRNATKRVLSGPAGATMTCVSALGGISFETTLPGCSEMKQHSFHEGAYKESGKLYISMLLVDSGGMLKCLRWTPADEKFEIVSKSYEGKKSTVIAGVTLQEDALVLAATEAEKKDSSGRAPCAVNIHVSLAADQLDGGTVARPENNGVISANFGVSTELAMDQAYFSSVSIAYCKPGEVSMSINKDLRLARYETYQTSLYIFQFAGDSNFLFLALFKTQYLTICSVLYARRRIMLLRLPDSHATNELVKKARAEGGMTDENLCGDAG